MNIYEQLSFQQDQPSAISIKKTEKQQIMAIGLGKGAVMKAHKTSVPTTLIVLKGTINFKIEVQELILEESSVFEIPVDVLHEVQGVSDQNCFLIVKEL